MRRLVFFAVLSCGCALAAAAPQRQVDAQHSTLTIRVGKTGLLSGFAHEHEIQAPLRSGAADSGSRPAVEIVVDARTLRVVDKNISEKDRAEIQRTMLGPQVLDNERRQEISFHSGAAEPDGEGKWIVPGNLMLRGITSPVTARVSLQDGHYLGAATMKLSDFGIKPPGKPGIRAKGEVKIDFDVRL